MPPAQIIIANTPRLKIKATTGGGNSEKNSPIYSIMELIFN